MPGLQGIFAPYLVVAAEPHEENKCLDIIEAVHPFSPLAALPPDVYQGVPVFQEEKRRGSWHDVSRGPGSARSLTSMQPYTHPRCWSEVFTLKDD